MKCLKMLIRIINGAFQQNVPFYINNVIKKYDAVLPISIKVVPRTQFCLFKPFWAVANCTNGKRNFEGKCRVFLFFLQLASFEEKLLCRYIFRETVIGHFAGRANLAIVAQ